MASARELAAPPDVREIRALIRAAYDTPDTTGQNGAKLGDATFGVYVLYDFERTPLYVGMTRESLRARLSRHLTNQRSDITKAVVDPWAVGYIEMCPLWQFQGLKQASADPAEFAYACEYLKRAESTVYAQLCAEFPNVPLLNEAGIAALEPVELIRGQLLEIIPAHVRGDRAAPDRQLARALQRLATLASVIRERAVDAKPRRLLAVQAERALYLADKLEIAADGESGTAALLVFLDAPAMPSDAHPDVKLAGRTNRLSSLADLLVGHPLDTVTKTTIVDELFAIACDADARFSEIGGMKQLQIELAADPNADE